METREYNVCKTTCANALATITSSYVIAKRLADQLPVGDESLACHMAVRCLMNSVHQAERALEVFINKERNQLT